MILKKTWERFARDEKGVGSGMNYLDTYTGWHLFGLLPLYIVRDRKRR